MAPPPIAIPPGTEAKLLPLKKGNEWTYSSEVVSRGETQTKDMVWRVASTRSANGGTEASIDMLQGGKVIDRQVWLQTCKGIFQVEAGKANTRFSPPQPIVTFPLKIGGEFKHSGKGLTPLGAPGSLSTNGRVLGYQEVDSEMGRAQAIAVLTRINFEAGKSKGLAETTSWFQPGIGLVRYRMDIQVGEARGGTVLRLKSTNVKL